jgi:GNAT superfamily N-acetyltransferase
VADEDGELFGHTTFGASRDDDAEADAGEVRAFFVSPRAWRRGLGRTLMAAALAGLRKLQYDQATLWSFDANDRANGFYEAHGFERDGATRREQQWGSILEVRYRRDLP